MQKSTIFKLSILLLLISAVISYQVTTSAQKRARALQSSSTAKDARAAQTALKAAIRALEKEDYETFFKFYVPVEGLRQVRKSGEMSKITQMMKSQPNNKRMVQQTIAKMKRFSTKLPMISQDGYLATFKMSMKGAEEIKPAVKYGKKIPEKTWPGYTGEIEAVIKAAIASLSRKDIKTFVSNLYPTTQLNLYAAEKTDWIKDLEARMKANPEMQQKMFKDFLQLQKLKPTFEQQNQVAVFKLPAYKYQWPNDRRRTQHTVAARTVKFQKQGDHWRFYDHTAEVRKQLATIEQQPQQDMDIIPTLTMEKIGNSWRLEVMPK